MVNENKKKVAVIGCGFFATNHILSWSNFKDVDLVGVCDLDEARAINASNISKGTPYFTDAEVMLKEVQPDVVDIVTTAPSHYHLAKLAASLNISAIIQKPMAPSLEEARKIVDLAETTKTPMMVHENFRFQKPIRDLKNLISNDEIGKHLFCKISFRTSFDIYQNQPYLKEVDQLVLLDLGVHVLDVARFLFGEASSISCRTQKTRSDIAGEDMATMMLGFSEERTAIVECSYGSKHAPDIFPETLVTVEGTNGSVVLEAGYKIIKRSGEKIETINAEPRVADWCEKPWHVVQDSVTQTCRHWIDTVPQNLTPEISVDDNLKTLKLVEAAYQSAAKGGSLITMDN
jgi:predicted dehydrogenase